MSNAGTIIDDDGLDILFRQARTHRQWDGREVTDVMLQAIYDLMRWGPTSANCCPARFKFVKSAEAKERLKPCLSKGNLEQTMAAPATAIIAYDMKFYEHFPRLFPHADMKAGFEGKPDHIRDTALRNGSLQGAYFMLAARSLGLDCGPMSGFKAQAVKEAFFPDEDVQVNFLCNLGYGVREVLKPRGPRFEFDEVCDIL
ncbi:MAG TPA: malonic semialdehyde reductase [Alphaproteobacteria bacterium]